MYILIKLKKDYIIALSRMGITMDKTSTIIIAVDIVFFTFLLLKFILSPLCYLLFRKGTKFMLIVTGILLILFLLIRYSGSKSAFDLRMEKEAFWNREQQANIIRKKDISGLDYLKIPLESLPLMDTADVELISLQNTIKELANKSILNLTGFTNTDLKLAYGTANLTFLSQCDGNYTLFAMTLYKWALWLHNHDMEMKAITVLEYGIQCKTDVSKHYLLLADYYIKNNQKNKLDELIQVAEGLKSLSKNKIIKSLMEMKL